MPGLNTISSRGMRALDMNAQYFGISESQLMENAGKAVADEIHKRIKGGRCVVFCGCGKNGGDGFVAARHLSSLGFQVTVVLVGKEKEIGSRCAQANWSTIKKVRGIDKIVSYDSSLIPGFKKVDVVVDALLGINIKGSLRAPLLQAVNMINDMKGYKVAVDVPTGIDPDSGRVMGAAVKADLTVTYHKLKVGLPKAKRYAGEVVVHSIGIPLDIESYVGPGDVHLVTKERPPEAHKGDFGKLLIIGGSELYSGAPALAALAALRTGVDMAYIAAPETTAYEISSMSPSLITIKLRGSHLNTRNVATIGGWLDRVDGVILGPGLGTHRDTARAVNDILLAVKKANTPLLLDADGLKIFATIERRIKIPKLVLTPHAGELKLLIRKEPSKELEVRADQVKKSAKEYGATVLLKGPIDVISDGVKVKYNFTGNPGMTVGGTGDTLSGIIGAFLAQGFDAFESACSGAFINGAAGDLAARELGYHLVPTDIVERIPRAMKESVDLG